MSDSNQTNLNIDNFGDPIWLRNNLTEGWVAEKKYPALSILWVQCLVLITPMVIMIHGIFLNPIWWNVLLLTILTLTVIAGVGSNINKKRLNSAGEPIDVQGRTREEYALERFKTLLPPGFEIASEQDLELGEGRGSTVLMEVKWSGETVAMLIRETLGGTIYNEKEGDLPTVEQERVAILLFEQEVLSVEFEKFGKDNGSVTVTTCYGFYEILGYGPIAKIVGTLLHDNRMGIYRVYAQHVPGDGSSWREANQFIKWLLDERRKGTAFET